MDVQTLVARLGGVRPVAGEVLVPMTEAEIAAVEALVQARLPGPYREFVATYGACSFNGESPDNPWILFLPVKPLPPQLSSSGNGLFDAFYGTEQAGRDAYSLPDRIRFYRGRMPPNLIPIGDDGGGNQICLGVTGAEAGKVYYWDLQNEPLDEEDYLEDYGEPMPPGVKFQNVHLVAESFEDFLLRLAPKSDS